MPTYARRGVSFGQIFPMRAAAQHPQNALDASPSADAFTAAHGRRLGLGQQRFDLAPLFVREFQIVSCRKMGSFSWPIGS